MLRREVQRRLQDDIAGETLVNALSAYVAEEKPDPLSQSIVDELFAADSSGALRGSIIRCNKRSHIMSELHRLLGWKHFSARELRAMRRRGE